MSANYLEIVKQVAQDLEPIIEKIDSLDFCPIMWDESYALLHELEDAVEKIDQLSEEELSPIFLDDSFCNGAQNKAFVENLTAADHCLIDFSSHFSRISSVLEAEGPKEWYDEDGEYMSAQLKKAKQHLDQILTQI